MSKNERTKMRGFGVFVAAATAAIALAGPGHAATAKAAALAGTGLSGIWLLDQHTYDVQDDFKAPFRPDIQAAGDAGYKQVKEGGKVLADTNAQCLPVGMPIMVTNEFALKFLETPGEVTVVSEQSSLVRTIFLNKKTHPTDQDPSWNGHSVGHWEGKTLVVDTVNLNDRTPHMPFVRAVVSLTTHITERYHVEDGGKTLVNVMTFDDPKVLAHPWTLTYKYHRAPVGTELWEYVCEVNAPGWSERFSGDPAFNVSKSAAAK